MVQAIVPYARPIPFAGRCYLALTLGECDVSERTDATALPGEESCFLSTVRRAVRVDEVWSVEREEGPCSVSRKDPQRVSCRERSVSLYYPSRPRSLTKDWWC